MTELRVVGKRRSYTRKQKAAAVVTAELSSTMAAAEKTGIPRTTIAYWLERPEFVTLRQKTREEMAEGFRVLAQLAQDRLEALIPTMEARDLTVLLGVAIDKSQLLSGHATERVEKRDITDTLSPDAMDALADDIDRWLASRKVPDAVD